MDAFLLDVGLLAQAVVGSPTHSFSSLLGRQAAALADIGLLLAGLWVPFWIMVRLRPDRCRLRRRFGRIVLGVSLLACLAYIPLLIHSELTNVTRPPVFFAFAFVLGALAGNMFVARDARRPLLGLALFFMFVSFAGSNRTYNAAVYGMWLALPLAVASAHLLAGRLLLGRARRIVLRAVLVPAGLVAILFASTYTFKEPIGRWRLTEAVDRDGLRCFFTLPERARAVERLLSWMDQHLDKRSPLLVANDLSLVHQLAGMRPFHGVSWYLTHSAADLERRLFGQKPGAGGMPYVLRHTVAAEDWAWPLRDNDGGRAARRMRQENVRRELLVRFIRENGFRVIWTDGYFEILAADSPVRI